MYGYMLLIGKFYELGEIELGTYHCRDGSMLAFPLVKSREHKSWKVSNNEREVYK